MNQSLFEALAFLEEKNFWFKIRNELILWALTHYFPKTKNFLEIGCGTGFVLSAIEHTSPELVLYGSDLSEVALQHAAKRLKKSVLSQMDARSIHCSHPVDVIGAFDVLEHIEEDRQALSQMFEAITPGGGILLTVPQHPFLWSQQDVYAGHVRRYTARELIQKVTAAGFQKVSVISFMSFLLPCIAAARFGKRIFLKEHDPLAELKLPTFLNTCFKKIAFLEMKLIQKGVRFPMGGSLLVVGYKP